MDGEPQQQKNFLDEVVLPGESREESCSVKHFAHIPLTVPSMGLIESEVGPTNGYSTDQHHYLCVLEHSDQ